VSNGTTVVVVVFVVLDRVMLLEAAVVVGPPLFDMTTSIPTSEASEASSVMEYELVAADVDAVASV